jgi:hypothetical protein
MSELQLSERTRLEKLMRESGSLGSSKVEVQLRETIEV